MEDIARHMQAKGTKQAAEGKEEAAKKLYETLQAIVHIQQSTTKGELLNPLNHNALPPVSWKMCKELRRSDSKACADVGVQCHVLLCWEVSDFNLGELASKQNRDNFPYVLSRG